MARHAVRRRIDAPRGPERRQFMNTIARKARFALSLGLLQLLCCAFSQSETKPKLDQILLQVQARIKEFETSLPDFMCRERITSRETVGGSIASQTIADSFFTGTQNKDEKSSPFTESREIQTINGRPAGKDEQLKVPFFFGGGFSSVLDATFGAKNIQYYNFKLVGSQPTDGKPALVVQFATKERQTGVFFEFLGSKFISKDTGTAWIDLESMHVIRLERQYLNLPPPYGVMSVSIRYARVVLNEKTFWMPSIVTVEETTANSKKPLGAQYIAEYSGYQKFDVNVRIKY